MPWSRLKVCKKRSKSKIPKDIQPADQLSSKVKFWKVSLRLEKEKNMTHEKPLILTWVQYFFVLLAVRMKVGTQRAAAPLFVATVAAANGFYADTQFTAAHHHRRRHHHHYHQQQHCLHHCCNPCNLIFTQISNSQNCRSSKLIETIFLLGKRARQ